MAPTPGVFLGIMYSLPVLRDRRQEVRASVLKAGGFEKAADTIRHSLPTKKRIQSGDLGEIIAVEFLHAHTSFRSPILKLRYKSDRDTALHGNDLIALDQAGKRPRVLKGECKSRANFSASHVPAAVEPLDAHGGRPNPSTLSFITKRLYEEGRDQEAAIFRDLQSTKALRLQDVEHLVFVLSGNNATSVLAEVPPPAKRSINKRWCVGLIVSEHGDFVSSVFTLAYGS